MLHDLICTTLGKSNIIKIRSRLVVGRDLGVRGRIGEYRIMFMT